jgi:hypothetical protein
MTGNVAFMCRNIAAFCLAVYDAADVKVKGDVNERGLSGLWCKLIIHSRAAKAVAHLFEV